MGAAQRTDTVTGKKTTRMMRGAELEIYEKNFEVTENTDGGLILKAAAENSTLFPMKARSTTSEPSN